MKPINLSRIVLLLVLASSALTAQVARQENLVPLRNWATPLYWHPNQAERETAGAASPQLQFSANAVSTNALTFVAITPCRLVDTRGAAAGFNGLAPFSGPSIAPAGTIVIPVQSTTEASTNTSPAPCGVIPSIAEAYSFNLTVVPKVSGTAIDYVTLWPSGTTQPFVSTLDDPQGLIVSSAAIVPAGPGGIPGYGGVSVYNAGPSATDVVIDVNGYFAAPSDLNGNTAIGAGTLLNPTTGADNTAVGAEALWGNSASNNTAVGAEALTSNGAGFDNTALGAEALDLNRSGFNNTAVGYGALFYNGSGNDNTAIGDQALFFNGGSNNIAIGFAAGYSLADSTSNNIHIGSQGVSSDSGVIRIGTVGTQTSTYIAGVYGGTLSSPSLPVCVDSNGNLGTTGCGSTPSSSRFKERVADMGDSSSKLLQLRPVTFLYKPQYDDGSHALQYGLIAEEVARLYPEMVGYDKDGQPSSVKYQMLAPMLLNEVQKQAERDRQQTEKIRSLEERLAALEALLSRESGTPARPASSQ